MTVIKRFSSIFLVACLAGGVLATGPLSAAAARASTAPTMTLTPFHPGLKKLSGHVFVVYRNQQYGTADVNDAITNVTEGEAATLYAQPFPYNKPPVGLETDIVPPGSTSAMFSDPVTPTVATRYTAALYASQTSTTPLATSNVATVYVLSGGRATAPKKCGRPVCHETIRVYTMVPPSTLKQEMAKHVYPYFGLSLNKRKEPPAPKWLRRGAGSARVAKARRISGHQFEVTIRYSFRIGTNGYHWLWAFCQKDSEGKDGLNLPGSHSCGIRRVRSNVRYLG